MNKLLPWLAGAVALGGTQSFAQTAASLHPIVVSAARVEQSLSDVIPSVSVISRQDIERSGAPTLIDLLQGEAGVEVGRNGGPGTVSSIFLRGQNSVSAAIFIDGVRAQVDQIGTIKLADIPLSMIDRVEILRGNVGALYGESAIGGVINITTRQPTGGLKSYGSLMLGSRGSSDLSVGLGNGLGPTRVQVSVQRFNTDGFSAMDSRQNPRVNPDRDGFRRESLFARIDHDLSEKASLGVSGNVIYSQAGFDSGFSPNTASDIHRLNSASSDLTLYSRLQLQPQWRSTLSITQSDLLYRDYKNSVQLPVASGGRIEGEQTSFRWDNTSAMGPGQVVFGADASQSRFSAYGSAHDRDASGAYAGVSSRWSRIDVQTNLRVDSVTGKSGAARASQHASTWLAGVGVLLTEHLRLTGAASTAFRAPATGELYGFGGNPGLRPEEHASREVGLVATMGGGLMRLVHFTTDTSNAIVYSNSSYSNVGRVENQGVELTYSADYRSMRVKLSAVSQDPRNAQTGVRLARRAKEYGSLDLSSRQGGLEFGGRVFYSGDRVDGGQTLGRYTAVNLYSSLQIAPEWLLRLRLENAFDERYQLVYGYNTPSRGVFLTLQHQPKN